MASKVFVPLLSAIDSSDKQLTACKNLCAVPGYMPEQLAFALKGSGGPGLLLQQVICLEYSTKSPPSRKWAQRAMFARTSLERQLIMGEGRSL